LTSGVVVCRGTLKRLDRAFNAFYARCKLGQTPGFPRFKPIIRFTSVNWPDVIGWRLKEIERRLYVQGIGDIRIRLHRPLSGTPKTISIVKEHKHWFVSFDCRDVPTEILPTTGKDVGIDLGVIAEVATSDDQLITGGRYGKRSAKRLAIAQQSLSKKQRGSKRRTKAVGRVANVHRKIRNQRSDLAHKLSRQLVNDYDLIVHEDLKIKNMVRRPKSKKAEDESYLPNGAAAKAGLNRSIYDAGWGQLISFITYKAESAGREVIMINPRHTSQRCAHCGHINADNRVSQSRFDCQACGHKAHADVNAAVNILEAGRALRTCAA
jgi:putative transposase